MIDGERPAEERLAGIAARVRRRLRARRQGRPGIVFGLGMFGLIGWAVAVPTVAGALLGVWIDRTWPSRLSWTLMLLLAGAALGCWNAWQWMKREGPSRDRDEGGD